MGDHGEVWKLRFASIYSYDPELFRQRFLGDTNVSGPIAYSCGMLQSMQCEKHLEKHLQRTTQAIIDYWNRNRGEPFFQSHPVLSDPALCLHYLGCSIFVLIWVLACWNLTLGTWGCWNLTAGDGSIENDSFGHPCR